MKSNFNYYNTVKTEFLRELGHFSLSFPQYLSILYSLQYVLHPALNHAHPAPITVCSPSRVSSSVSMALSWMFVPKIPVKKKVWIQVFYSQYLWLDILLSIWNHQCCHEGSKIKFFLTFSSKSQAGLQPLVWTLTSQTIDYNALSLCVIKQIRITLLACRHVSVIQILIQLMQGVLTFEVLLGNHFHNKSLAC